MRLLHLEGEIVVLLLLLGSQRVPPFAEDLRNGPIVLVGVPLVHQRPVPLAEDHERVHRPPYVILLFRLSRAFGFGGEGTERLSSSFSVDSRRLGGGSGGGGGGRLHFEYVVVLDDGVIVFGHRVDVLVQILRRRR